MSSIYLNDFNVKIIIVLFIISTLTIVAHRLGIADIHFDLQKEENYSFISPMLNGDVSGSVSALDDRLSAKCTVKSLREYTNCGISIGVGPHLSDAGKDISIGVDFSKYNRFEYNVKHIAPDGKGRIKISFRHFDPKISNKYQFTSLKHNSIMYDSTTPSYDHVVSLSKFKVENWWLKNFEVAFEDSHLDFSNIIFVEVTSDNIQLIGDFSYQIDKAILHGKLISELDLLRGIAFVWLLAILLLAIRQAKHLDTLSKIDSLTTLLNRRGIAESINQAFIKKQINSKSYLIYFDLVGFKKINDTHGHQIGDQVLIVVSKLVKSTIQARYKSKLPPIIGRLGGDEFVAKLDRIDEAEAISLVEDIIEKISEPIDIYGRLIKVGVSIGIVSFDEDVSDFTSLLDLADTAMYIAKKEGTNQYRLYNSVKELVYKRREIVTNLNQCLDQGLFELYYMPIVSSNDNSVKKVEVLLRTNHPDLTAIGPDQFIPIAEDFGLIHLIDLWVVEATFKKIVEIAKDPLFTELTFCINISSKEINNPKFINDFSSLLSKYPVNPYKIELEITETSLVEIDRLTVSLLNQLRALGVKLALDDFGTGYSSFQHMIEYPIDCLKIDKSFIDNFDLLKEANKTIISSMIAIGKANKLETVAEGVETEAQREFLAQVQCDLLQGYLFSQPVKWDAFTKIINSQKDFF